MHPIMTLDDHFLYTDVFTGSSEVWAEKILCSEGNPSFSTDSVVRFTIDSGYDWFSGTEPERKPGVTCTLNACPKMSRSGSSTFGYSFIFPGIFGIKQRIHLSLNMVVYFSVQDTRLSRMMERFGTNFFLDQFTAVFSF